MVLPEYAAMELTSALPAAVQGDLHGELSALQELLPAYRAAAADAARRHRVHLLAGSAPERSGGVFHNVARLYAPSGADAAWFGRSRTVAAPASASTHTACRQLWRARFTRRAATALR